MTDSELNEEICKWQGWKNCGKLFPWIPPKGFVGKNKGLSQPHKHLPSHILGLEALGNMNEAEKGLTESQHTAFRTMLANNLGLSPHYSFREVVSASARQRGIALLHVVKPELFQL